MQGAQVRPLVRELDLTCCNWDPVQSSEEMVFLKIGQQHRVLVVCQTYAYSFPEFISLALHIALLRDHPLLRAQTLGHVWQCSVMLENM